MPATTVGDERGPHRIPPDRRLRRRAAAGDQDGRRRSTREQSNTSIDRRQQIRDEDAAPHHRRHPSRDRDRPLPHRRRAFPERAALARQRSNWSKATSAARSWWCTASSRTRATPGRVTGACARPPASMSSACWPTETVPETPEAASMLQRMRQIGKRTAEMHLAFASQPDDPDFAPEPITADDVARWTDARDAARERCFATARSAQRDLPEPARRWRSDCSTTATAIIEHIDRGRARTFGGAEDPPPRRLPSRPGADRQGRCLSSSTSRASRAAPSTSAGARRRRRATSPASLRSIDYAVSAAIDRAPDLSAEERAALGAAHPRLGASARRRPIGRAIARRIGDTRLWPADDDQTHERCSICSCWKRRSTRSNTNSTNRPDLGRVSRSKRRCASSQATRGDRP